MSQELKPCPLCNYPLLLSNDHTWWIHSWNEQCCLDPVRIKADDEARIAAWNTRVSDTRIAELEAEVSARGIEAHQMRAERDAAKADAANWHRLHDELEAEVERLREQVRLSLEAENAAKDAFWAVYPAYIEKHGHGISEEDAKRMRSDNEASIMSSMVQP